MGHQNSSINRLYQGKDIASTSDKLIAGEKSFGAMLESVSNGEYLAIPSPKQPTTGKDEYFDGESFKTTITKKYGSANKEGPALDASQLATPKLFRVDGGKETRQEFGKALGKAKSKIENRHHL